MKRGVNPVVKIFLVAPGGRDESFCGPGMIKLLLAIKQIGNVRQACEIMKMSYSKGWKLLKGLEAWLDFPVVVRHQGGKGGGEAYLTEEGCAFLEKHLVFLQESQEAVQHIFERYYGSGDQPEYAEFAQNGDNSQVP
ncbi:MAG: LysR family transcriptional regulator [Treponema sp.]|jgi:molybdate transport system regulatory protein|nr:LysR family transcriptional regulator [Treponema sp.]